MRYNSTIPILLAVAAAFLPVPVLAAQASPLLSLSDAEKSYYAQTFDYTMDTVKAGEHHEWQSYGGSGSIAVSENFVSKSGATCRNFTENFTVGDKAGGDKGVACKRTGKEGWCKLKEGSEALTCALEDPAMMLHMIIPGYNGSMPDGDIDTDVDVNRPDIDTHPTGPLDVGGARPHGDVKGSDVANTVTGTAGNAAGSAAGAFKDWFSDNFR